MTSLPEALAAPILARCGRRCCICRRFKPVLLQVHHIVERSDGGTDDPDNLIPICLTCHVDVHSKVPFVQRFTVTELKLHRDNLFKVIANGRLTTEEEERIFSIQVGAPVLEVSNNRMMPEAMTLLIQSATNDGTIWSSDDITNDPVYNRKMATMRKAIQELTNLDLIEYSGGIVYQVTHDGYLVADQLMALVGADAKNQNNVSWDGLSSANF